MDYALDYIVRALGHKNPASTEKLINGEQGTLIEYYTVSILLECVSFVLVVVFVVEVV